MIASEPLGARVPILRETVLQIADPQVRHRWTPSAAMSRTAILATTPAVTLALGADFGRVAPPAKRSIPARDDHRGAFTTALADDEVLTAYPHPVPQPPVTARLREA